MQIWFHIKYKLDKIMEFNYQINQDIKNNNDNNKLRELRREDYFLTFMKNNESFLKI